MLLQHKAKHPESEHGFTLIELMVTVLILGVLIAIALPTFLGARARASERAAQVRLKESLTAAKVFFVDSQTYTGFDSVQLRAIEPTASGNMLPAPNATQDEISIRVANGRDLLLVTQSGEGVYYCLAEDVTGLIRGAHPTVDGFTTVADCAAAPQSW